mmetsp:Transcript_69482/g.134054  ORF Transcript_69482/g.134054 Transcript_69482/m.134054 type:complete len:90 (-) Transcript_69482:118-387(-)
MVAILVVSCNPPATHVMDDFKAKHDIFSMQQAGPFGASSVTEFLQVLMSSLQQCACVHLLTSAEHLFSLSVVVPAQTTAEQVVFGTRQT